MKIFVWNKFSASHKVFIDATFQMLRILLSSPTFLCSWFLLSLPKKKKATFRMFFCVYFKPLAELFKWLIFLFPLLGVLFLRDLIRVFHKILTINGFCNEIHDLYLYLPSPHKSHQVLCKHKVLVLWDQMEEKWNSDRDKISDHSQIINRKWSQTQPTTTKIKPLKNSPYKWKQNKK